MNPTGTCGVARSGSWADHHDLAERLGEAGLPEGRARQLARAADLAAQDGEDSELIAALLHNEALTRHNLGDPEAAETALTRARDVLGDATDTTLTRAHLHDTSGMVAREAGRLAAAQRHHETALDLVHDLPGDEAEEVRLRARLNRAIARKDQGEVHEARDLAAGVVTAARPRGLSDLAGNAELTLALVAELLRDDHTAIAHQRAAIPLLLEAGTPEAAATAWHNLALRLSAVGRHDEAEDALDRSSELNRRHHLPVGIAADTAARAALALARGDRARARRLHEQALPELLRAGDVRGGAQTIADLAHLDLDEHDTSNALRRLDSGVQRRIAADRHRRPRRAAVREPALARAVDGGLPVPGVGVAHHDADVVRVA